MSGWRLEIERLERIVDKEYLTTKQATAIGSLWEHLRPKRIVEIGTFKGTGACYLGALAKFYDGHVTTIDLPWTGRINDKITVLAETQLAACGVDNVTVVRREDGAEGWFREFFLRGEPPLDFVYLDGGHQWLNTAAQFAMAWSALRSGGWICMDDLEHIVYPDVDLVWREIAVRLAPNKDRYTANRQGFAMRR